MSNAEQVAHWDGAEGAHWAEEQDRYDRMNLRFGDRIIDAVKAQPGEHILDVGCGNGALSLALAQRVVPTGSVTGLDISGPMLATATRRAGQAGIEIVSFTSGDAQAHPLEESRFDAVVSRFGVMFFGDPLSAFSNLARGLRTGGRVVFACWRDLLENEWLTVPVLAALAHVPMPQLGTPGAPGPFSLADAAQVRALLDGATSTTSPSRRWPSRCVWAPMLRTPLPSRNALRWRRRSWLASLMTQRQQRGKPSPMRSCPSPHPTVSCCTARRGW